MVVRAVGQAFCLAVVLMLSCIHHFGYICPEVGQVFLCATVLLVCSLSPWQFASDSIFDGTYEKQMYFFSATTYYVFSLLIWRLALNAFAYASIVSQHAVFICVHFLAREVSLVEPPHQVILNDVGSGLPGA